MLCPLSKGETCLCPCSLASRKELVPSTCSKANSKSIIVVSSFIALMEDPSVLEEFLLTAKATCISGTVLCSQGANRRWINALRYTSD